MSAASVGQGGDLGLGWRVALFAVALAASLGVGFLAGPIPAMVDYPNHLARMSVLTRAGTPAANPYYILAWALYPNLAMDIVVPPFARLMGVVAATRAFLLLSQMLVVAGAAAIEGVVKRRFGYAATWAALLLYSDPFAWGFVNFEFGLGLALLAFAAWIAGRERPFAQRFAFHCIAAAVLFVSHLLALGVYGWAVGLYELWRWRRDRGAPKTLAITGAGLAAPVVVLAALTVVTGGGVGGPGAAWDFKVKLLWLLCLDGYSWLLSITLSLGLILLAYILARRGLARLTGAGPMLAAGFAGLFLIMPHKLADTEFVDVRIVVAALLILPAFTMVQPLPARLRRIVVLVVGIVGAADLADVAWVQAGYRSDYKGIQISLARLPQGARVLVGHSGEGLDPPRDLAEYAIYDAPVLAVHTANAFVPNLFAYPGKQPILPRAWIRPLSIPQGGPVPLPLLTAIAQRRDAGRAPSFVAHWTRDFDILYLVGPAIANPLPGVLQPLASGRRFGAYRIITAPARWPASATPQGASR